MAKRVAKLLPILAIVVVVVVYASGVEGAGRKILKEEKENVDQPQNFLGGTGGLFPSPGGLFPSPGFTGVGFGPSGFCTFPGGCTPSLPTNPGFGFGGSPPHA